MNILLIEDDRNIASALVQALAHSHAITRSETGLGGIERAGKDHYDAIILDLNLPDMSGLKVCEQLRKEGCTAPVLILSGEAQVMSKIRLLDAGADDYLTKPFSLGELKARLRVLARKTPHPTQESRVLEVGELKLDPNTHEATRQKQVIRLRRKEFALLECLMRHAGSVVNRETLGAYAWQGSDSPWTNTIDVHIKHLRDKIDRPFDEALIKTIHGLGYKIAVPPVKPTYLPEID